MTGIDALVAAVAKQAAAKGFTSDSQTLVFNIQKDGRTVGIPFALSAIGDDFAAATKIVEDAALQLWEHERILPQSQ